MSYYAINWAKEVKTGSVGKKAVLLVLADRADENDSCFPGQETIAEETEQSVRTVQRQLAELEADGFISRLHRVGSQGHRTSDRYVLKIPTRQSVALDSDTPDVPTRQHADVLPDNTPKVLPDTAVVGTISKNHQEPSDGTSPPAPSPKRSLRPLPPDWQPTDKHRGEASNLALNLEAQAILFRNSALANDRRYKNWDAAFSNWLIRAVQYAGKPVKQERPRSYLYGEA